MFTSKTYFSPALEQYNVYLSSMHGQYNLVDILKDKILVKHILCMLLSIPGVAFLISIYELILGVDITPVSVVAILHLYILIQTSHLVAGLGYMSIIRSFHLPGFGMTPSYWVKKRNKQYKWTTTAPFSITYSNLGRLFALYILKHLVCHYPLLTVPL